MNTKKLLLAVLFFLTLPGLTHATTYYVRTDGHDSASGLNDTNNASTGAWLNPQKCVDTGSVLVGGDTCMVGNGTYTDTDGNNIVIYVRGNNGTSLAAPITIQAQNYLGAKLTIPALASPGAYGVYVARNYIAIRGFEISGGGSNGTTTSITGVGSLSSNTGLDVDRNYFHDIGYVCSTSVYGFDGISHNANSTTIQRNIFETIGRESVAEGCASGTTLANPVNDHGIYLQGGSTATIKNNYFITHKKGWGIQFHSTSTAMSGVNIYNNTFYGNGGNVSGHIILGSTNLNSSVNIKNNIFDTPLNYATTRYNSGTGTFSAVVISNNQTSVATFDNPSALDGPLCSAAGVTCSSNATSTASGFVNGATHDFSLTSGAAAINAGVDVGLPYLSTAPDKGAVELIAVAAAQVTNATPTIVNISFSNISGADPVVKIANPTISGHTVSSCAVSGSIASQIDCTVTAAFVNGEATRTATFVAGDVTNSINIGGSKNSKILAGATNITNLVGGSAPVLAQTRFRIYDQAGAANAASTIIMCGENTNCPTVSPGIVRARLKVTCDATANCPATGFQMWFSEDGGAYAVLPDACGGSNHLCNCTVPNLVNGVATTRIMTTDQTTFVAGGILLDSSTSPSVDLNASNETEMEWVLCTDTGLTLNKTFDLRIRKSDGTVINTYSQTPRLTINSPIAYFTSGAK